MKAAIYTQYGPPDVVKIADIPIPVIKENEVLVKVIATTVNRTDCGFRSAQYFISRFWSGLFKPKNQVLGCEFAGVIEKVGKNVTLFSVGQTVFGYDDIAFGSHAEYKVIAEDKTIATIPENLSYSQAAALTEGAHYALCNLRAAKVKQGSKVMVYGATGAIGSAAVQLAKYFGANVTAVCNTKNVDLLHSLGADVVIDYQTQDFTKTNTKFDFIFDAVGKTSFGKTRHLLKEKGIYISTEFGKNSQNVFFALTTSISKGKRVLFPLPTINKEDVLQLKQMAEEKKFTPVVDREYPLEEIVDAYKYVETRQKTGNVIITVI